MKQTALIMGMPITLEITDQGADKKIFKEIFDYFRYIDKTFSTYKKNSEISKINRGILSKKDWSADMKTIFRLSEKTKRETKGYFDIFYKGTYDPSGIVKGWAIFNAAKILEKHSFKNFYIDAGGDIQVSGKVWRVGIKNPFKQEEIVKVLEVKNSGVATSGTYIRGAHIYNPKTGESAPAEIVSMSVIGHNIYDADRFATAAFAMGKKGIFFIEGLKGFEGYMIDSSGVATATSGFEKYEIH